MKEEKFEDKLNKLEELSSKIKSGELPLEETVNNFEEGMKLAESLEQEITSIERRIEILVNKPSADDEQPVFKDFQE